MRLFNTRSFAIIALLSLSRSQAQFTTPRVEFRPEDGERESTSATTTGTSTATSHAGNPIITLSTPCVLTEYEPGAQGTYCAENSARFIALSNDAVTELNVMTNTIINYDGLSFNDFNSRPAIGAIVSAERSIWCISGSESHDYLSSVDQLLNAVDTLMNAVATDQDIVWDYDILRKFTNVIHATSMYIDGVNTVLTNSRGNYPCGALMPLKNTVQQLKRDAQAAESQFGILDGHISHLNVDNCVNPGASSEYSTFCRYLSTVRPTSSLIIPKGDSKSSSSVITESNRILAMSSEPASSYPSVFIAPVAPSSSSSFSSSVFEPAGEKTVASSAKESFSSTSISYFGALLIGGKSSADARRVVNTSYARTDEGNSLHSATDTINAGPTRRIPGSSTDSDRPVYNSAQASFFRHATPDRSGFVAASSSVKFDTEKVSTVASNDIVSPGSTISGFRRELSSVPTDSSISPLSRTRVSLGNSDSLLTLQNASITYGAIHSSHTSVKYSSTPRTSSGRIDTDRLSLRKTKGSQHNTRSVQHPPVSSTNVTPSPAISNTDSSGGRKDSASKSYTGSLEQSVNERNAITISQPSLCNTASLFPSSFSNTGEGKRSETKPHNTKAGIDSGGYVSRSAGGTGTSSGTRTISKENEDSTGVNSKTANNIGLGSPLSSVSTETRAVSDVSYPVGVNTHRVVVDDGSAGASNVGNINVANTPVTASFSSFGRTTSDTMKSGLSNGPRYYITPPSVIQRLKGSVSETGITVSVASAPAPPGRYGVVGTDYTSSLVRSANERLPGSIHTHRYHVAGDTASSTILKTASSISSISSYVGGNADFSMLLKSTPSYPNSTTSGSASFSDNNQRNLDTAISSYGGNNAKRYSGFEDTRSRLSHSKIATTTRDELSSTNSGEKHRTLGTAHSEPLSSGASGTIPVIEARVGTSGPNIRFDTEGFMRSEISTTPITATLGTWPTNLNTIGRPRSVEASTQGSDRSSSECHAKTRSSGNPGYPGTRSRHSTNLASGTGGKHGPPSTPAKAVLGYDASINCSLAESATVKESTTLIRGSTDGSNTDHVTAPILTPSLEKGNTRSAATVYGESKNKMVADTATRASVRVTSVHTNTPSSLMNASSSSLKGKNSGIVIANKAYRLRPTFMLLILSFVTA